MGEFLLNFFPGPKGHAAEGGVFFTPGASSSTCRRRRRIRYKEPLQDSTGSRCRTVPFCILKIQCTAMRGPRRSFAFFRYSASGAGKMQNFYEALAAQCLVSSPCRRRRRIFYPRNFIFPMPPEAAYSFSRMNRKPNFTGNKPRRYRAVL